MTEDKSIASPEDMVSELRHGIKLRDHLLDDAVRLLAAGSGESSSEYMEFLKLRAKMFEVVRIPDQYRYLESTDRQLSQMRRMLASIDPVASIVDFIKKQVHWGVLYGSPGSAALFILLIERIERGDWLPCLDPRKSED